MSTELAADVEPWDEGRGKTTPHGVYRKHLARFGYGVEYIGREEA